MCRPAALARAARAEVRSGWEAQSKVRALSALVKLGDASPLRREELRRSSKTWLTIRHPAPAMRRRWFSTLVSEGRRGTT